MSLVADGVLIDEPPAPAHVRSWSDVIRLVVAGVVLAVVGLATKYGGDGISAIERDLLRFLTTIIGPIQSLLVAAIQTVAAYAPLAGVVLLLVLRQFRRLGLTALASIVAIVLMRLALLLVDAPASSFVRLAAPGLDTGRATFPSPTYVAFATAVLTTQWPWLSRAWRRTAVIGLVVAGFGRLLAGTTDDVPHDLLLGYALGWFVGGALLLAAGRPNHRPRAGDVVAALRRCAVELTEIHDLGDRGGGVQVFRAVDEGGRELFVKVRRGGERAADGALRLYRNVRLRQPVGEHPFWAPVHSAEHEALAVITAGRAGVPVPVVVAVSAVGANRKSSLLAASEVRGDRLDELADAAWTDEVLARVWEALAAMRAAGVAHRNLHLGNLRWDAEARAAMVFDFDRAELAADPDLLTDDVVELLCATATRVGPVRAVGAAAEALDRVGLAEVLPRLQPLVLSFATRSEVRRSPDLLERLRHEINETAPVDEVPLAQLERIRPRTVLLVVMSALGLYFVLPELARSSSAFDFERLRQADPWWVAGALVASAASYVGAAIALWGAVPRRVSLLGLTSAQVACQFANFATPAQVGGMALNARFLQRRGTDAAVAVTAIGLNAATGALVHLGLLGVFVYWAGSQDTTQFELPTATILAVLGVAAVVGLITIAIPIGRRFVRRQLLPIVGRAAAGLHDISRSPGKIAALVGGAVLLTGTYTMALACSVAAFGGDVPLVNIGVVFLGSSLVAAAAPTPGGLVAVETSLVAGLTGIGLTLELAVGAVLVFRLATFWIPLLPGWLTFTALQRRGDL